jgi:thioredoxin 2
VVAEVFIATRSTCLKPHSRPLTLEIEKPLPHAVTMESALHLVCPQCDGVNRVPGARLTDAPRCGTCHQPLLSGHPLELTTTNFRRHIERNDLPVVVDFWAPWCGPCRGMAPEFERAADGLKGTALLAKVNTESEPDLAGQFGIRSIPTLIAFRGGREIARQAGALSREQIERWARSCSA